MIAAFGALLVGLVVGAPVAFALALAGLVYMLGTGEYFSAFSAYLFGALNSSTLLSVPFFILSAEILNRSGATDRLIRMVDAWVGHNRGGLPVVAVIAVAFFAAICGSSAATAAAVGSVIIPEMIKRGYSQQFSVGLIAASGGLGILIPPSIPLIIYGMVTETSIGGLFKAAMLPGVVLALALGIAAYIIGRRSGIAPTPRASFKERMTRTRGALGVLLMPIIVLGGIYSGTFTPTESAAVACIYALALAVVGYRVPLRRVPRMLTMSASTAGMILLILAAANLFSYALTSERIPHAVFEYVAAQNFEVWQLLLVLMLFFVVCGMFLEVISIILIIMPILVPVLAAAKIDLVHFAVLLIVNMELAVITPPIGLNLFILSAITGAPVMQVFRGTLPFALIIVLVLTGLMFIPGSALLTTGW